MSDIIYQTDYCVVRHQQGTAVAIQVGNPPEEARPTIVPSTDLVVALNEFLRSEKSDG